MTTECNDQSVNALATSLSQLGDRLQYSGDHMETLLERWEQVSNQLETIPHGTFPQRIDVVAIDEEVSVDDETLDPDDGLVIENATEAGTAIRVRKKRYSHRGRSWNPMESRKGEDNFSFTVPDGYVYSHHSLKQLNSTFPHELRVKRSPSAGSSGRQSIKAHWKLWGNGQVSYEIHAVCRRESSPPVQLEVLVGSRDWVQKAQQFIDQRKNFKLVVEGPDAKRLWDSLMGHSHTEVEPVIVITLGIVVVALGGFATLAFLLTQAINALCDSKASFEPQGRSGRLFFDIKNCQR